MKILEKLGSNFWKKSPKNLRKNFGKNPWKMEGEGLFMNFARILERICGRIVGRILERMSGANLEKKNREELEGSPVNTSGE